MWMNVAMYTHADQESMKRASQIFREALKKTGQKYLSASRSCLSVWVSVWVFTVHWQFARRARNQLSPAEQRIQVELLSRFELETSSLPTGKESFL